ncbi:MAG: hypothetical protein H6843_13020 [Rhodospirillaceae bacterium]|nr:hypothetical protein [Rhodospirillaceae bacterium]
MSPLGLYPKKSVSTTDGKLIVTESAVWSIIPIDQPEVHGLTPEHFSELDDLALEEIRFFVSLALAGTAKHRMIYNYPFFLHTDIDDDYLTNNRCLTMLLESISETSKLDISSLALPPICGGPNYKFQDFSPDVNIIDSVAATTSLQDHLVLRGLNALLKADMLWQHRAFGEVAIIYLFIALDASFQIILRHLRAQGTKDPSAIDAGKYIENAFGQDYTLSPYFSDYYETRIRSIHPQNRFGIYPFAPLLADDYYDLREQLNVIFLFLLTEKTWLEDWLS